MDLIEFAGRRIRLHGRLRDTDRGLIVEKGGLEGLFDGAPIRRQEVERIGHGSFVTPSTVGDRLITVRGLAVADSWFELQGYRDSLMSLAMEPLGKLTAQVDGEVRWCEAVPHGDAKFKVFPGSTVAQFLIMLWCPLPWLYGESRIYSGTSKPETFGTVPAFPQVTFKGDFSAGFRLVVGDGGGEWTYTKAASNAVLDTRTMQLRSATGALLAVLPGRAPSVSPWKPGSWWSVSATGGKTGTLEVRVTDTYV